MNLPGMESMRQSFHTVGRSFKQASDYIRHIPSKVFKVIHTHTEDTSADRDLEANVLSPTPTLNEPPMVHLVPDAEKLTAAPEPRQALSISVTGLQINRLSDISQTPVTPNSAGKQLWRNAMRTVRMHSALSTPLVTPHEPYRQRTTSSSKREPVRAVFRSRVAALVPKLQVLETTQDLAAHQALVRHLEFSPDGRYLATSR